MIKSMFGEACNRISASGIRKISQADAEILYKILSYVDDVTFPKIIDEYCSMESPPKNLEGFVKRRNHELNTVTESRGYDEEDSGPMASPEEVKYFMACVRRAIAVFGGTSEEYKKWTTVFNDKVMSTTGPDLIKFLKEHLKALYETTPQRSVQNAA